MRTNLLPKLKLARLLAILVLVSSPFYMGYAHYMGYAQEKLVANLHGNEVNTQAKLQNGEEKLSVQNWLNNISNRRDIHFIYNPSLLENKWITTAQAKESKNLEAIKRTLEDLGLKLIKSSPNQYIIKPADEKGIKPVSVIQPKEEVQQAVTLSGKVVDADTKEGLPGVNVLLKGSSNGTVTDGNGAYTLSVPDGNGTLVFSYIGYMPQEVAINNQTEISISLRPDIKSLSEVVVVGYGTQQKGHLTGAIASVKLDQEINSRPIVEFGQALYGKVAGVQVINTNGRPGSSSSIQIRGINSVSASSSPLIVVDGLPMPNYDLNLINSADIESIEVLKDAASAAIYGSRGANGVVLVTTKSGKEGTAKINLNYSFGMQEVIDKIDVMNAAEYAQASIDAAQNGWIESGGDPAAPNTIEARKQYKYTWPTALENPENLTDTDWQDVIFRVAPMHKLDLNVSGGTAKTNFMLSGGYINQKGIVINSDYNKYTFSIKAASKVKDWLEVGGMLSLSYDHENEPFNRIVEWAVQYPPIYPVYGNNGYLGAPANTEGFEKYDAILFRPKNGHPLYQINDDIQHKRFNNLGNMFAQFKLLPGLNFKSAFNYFYNRTDNSNYQAIDHNLGPTYNTEGVMTVNQNNNINYTWQNLLTYDKSLGDHNISALLGTEYNNNNFHYTNQERRGYDNDLVHALSAGRTVFQAEDNETRSVLISYFSRLNYNFKGKYLLSASLRRDGSSRFGPNNKWGFFPSLSGGWIVSDEAFLKGINQISNLKIRASYGFTGNDRFADYRWIGSMSQGRIAFGNNLGITYYPSSITNRDLEWERTQQLNFGLDAGFFNNRVTLEADYYISKSDGLLLDVPVPVATGFTSIFKNIGKLENKGFELNLTTYNLTGDFQWNTQINFSRNQNKVLALGKDNAPMIYQPGFGMESINMVGQPIFSFYGYKYLGVYKNQAEIDADAAHYKSAVPGDGKYEDVNKDGVLNADDRTLIGNYTPDFIWGITNNFKYKGFDLSFLWQGVQGSDVYDNNIHRSMLYHEGRNYYKEAVNRWRSEEEPGDGYHYKFTVNLDGYEKTASSYWIVDGSYFRLKSLTLGYTFPASLLNKIRLGSLRVYVNGLNLFTKKNSPIFDPENSNGDVTDASRRGVTHSPYPTAKIYTFGLNIGF